METITWPLWECLDYEAQQKLRAVMPKNWQPPASNQRYIIVPLEKLDEIDRIMRQKPQHVRKVK